LGAVRLNKILFYIDGAAFRSRGRSLTGESYVKRQLGPVPKHILKVLGELEHEGAIVIRNFDHLGDPIRQYVMVKDPKLSALTPEDLAMAEGIRSHICDNHTGSSIAELSHDQVWEAANIGEPIRLKPPWHLVSERSRKTSASRQRPSFTDTRPQKRRPKL
jgi:hypothetical protein